jgi:hypothetical protein
MKKLLKKNKCLLMATAIVAGFLTSCSEKDDLGKSADLSLKTTFSKTIVTIGDTGVTEINYDLTLSNTYIYQLKGDVRIDSGYTLTIPAGTVIIGDKATKGLLTIKRGARIYATGTASSPIVFTSSETSPASQDWGGVIILGSAPTNQSNPKIEGIPTYRTQLYYGGSNSSDNSGTFQYVRIEYAGIPITEGNETNGLTMGGVGSGTTIDHVMVSYGGDDGFEWFGGTVNAKYLISFANLDDDFDTDFGFSGHVQYGIVLRDPTRADVSKSNGFESDNNGTSPYSGTTQTSAVFCNFTVIGPYGPGTTSASSYYQDGIHMRRNTGISIYNTIVTGWRRNGVYVDATVTSGILAYNTVVAPYGVSTALVSTQAGTYTPWTSGTANVGYTATSADDDALLCGLPAEAWTLTGPTFVPDTEISGITPSTVNSNFTDYVTIKGAVSSDYDWSIENWVDWTPGNNAY